MCIAVYYMDIAYMHNDIFMVALWNRADHYIFILSLWTTCVADADIIFLSCGFFFYLLSFYSSPNLSRRRLDAYHTSTHSVALVRI